MEYLKLGTILDSFGLDGTLKVYSTTQNQALRYKKNAKVFLYSQKDDLRIEAIVEHYRSNGNMDFIKLKDIDNPEKAKEYKGFEIHTIKDRNDLEVGYYFYSDLVGCSVLDESENILGTVSVVEEFPAQITLRVKRNGKPDFFVPFIKQFIIDVNIDKKTIKINVLDGMLWK